MTSMFDYKGKTALITGASIGIGAAFARELAERGMDLILVARSAEKLRALAVKLQQKHSIRAEIIVTDLTKENAADRVGEAVEELRMPVDLLVNNAGFGTHGEFHTLDAGRESDEIALNVAALVSLTHRFLPAMLARGDGGVINVASLAAFQPISYMAVYGATKAFVLSFSEALWAEYRGRGVRVLALCPSATDTPFFENVGSEHFDVKGKETPEQVVAAGLRAFEREKSYVVSGTKNWLLAQTSRFVPRSVVARLARQLASTGKDVLPSHAL